MNKITAYTAHDVMASSGKNLCHIYAQELFQKSSKQLEEEDLVEPADPGSPVHGCCGNGGLL